MSAVPIQTLIRGFMARCLLPRKRQEVVVKAQTTRQQAVTRVQRWWHRVCNRQGKKAFRELHLSDFVRGVEETQFEDMDEALLAEHIPDSSDSETSARDSVSVRTTTTASTAAAPVARPKAFTEPAVAQVEQQPAAPPAPAAPEVRPASQAVTVVSLTRSASDPAPPASLLPGSTLRVQSQAMLSKAPIYATPLITSRLSALLDLPSAEEIMTWGATHRDAAPLLTHPGGIKVDSDDPIGAKLMTLLAITYHNIAAEEEHLGDFQRCLVSYRVAMLTAEDALGPGHTLALHLRGSWERSQRALAEREKLRALTASGRVTLGPRAKRNQWAQRQKAAVAAANLTTRPITGGSVLRSTEERRPAKITLTRLPVMGPPTAPELERRMEEVAKREQHALNQVERQLEAAASYAPLDAEAQAHLRQLQVMRRRHEKELLRLDLKSRVGTERTPPDGGQEKWQLWKRQSQEKRALLHQLRGVLLDALGYTAAADEPPEEFRDSPFSEERPTASNALQPFEDGDSGGLILVPLQPHLRTGSNHGPPAPSPTSPPDPWQQVHPWAAGDMPSPNSGHSFRTLGTPAEA
eukprot:GGOE01001050.1.p1 GENE.GGOE01001050.1~~GGOE01001050.1.p1  ORF type:complete len:674 (+),score=191.71 GGOE01001050.1:286-2022(+)